MVAAALVRARLVYLADWRTDRFGGRADSDRRRKRAADDERAKRARSDDGPVLGRRYTSRAPGRSDAECCACRLARGDRAVRGICVCPRRVDVSCVRGVRHGAEPRCIPKGGDLVIRTRLTLALLTAAAIALPVCAAAQIEIRVDQDSWGRPVFRLGQDFVLRAGTEVREAVVVFGDATIDGHVDQDVVVVLGKA